MAGYKETPRQKMIAMMYLVLTAMLALNVSKEMLDAFVVVNESVELTNENFNQKLNETYTSFDKKLSNNQSKVKAYWKKAQEAKSMSDEMVDYIEGVKWQLIAEAENITVDSAKTVTVANMQAKDDYSTPTNFFMGDSDNGSKGEGKVLKQKIDDYRQNMLALLDPEDREKIKLGLRTDGEYQDIDDKTLNWIQYNFWHTIMAADITILNKIITEIYNAEFDVANFLLNDIDAEDFKYDMVDAKVLPKTNYVFKGDDYEAEIIVAAYSTTQNPEVLIMQGIDSLTENQISNATPIEGKDGKVKITLPGNTIGPKKFAGIVRIKGGVGDINTYYFNDEYMVAEPSLTVSAKKMNVFYMGVDNPVAISVPGITPEDIIPTISFGTLKPDPENDDWLVSVPVGQRETVISVTAEIDGKKRDMGSATFRIKKLPDPVALIAGKNDGTINRNILVAAGGIVPKMPDDFEFEFTYRILSFKMVLQRGSDISDERSSNHMLTEAMIRKIQSANRGQKIWFENIRAIGPDKIERPLAPIILTLN